MRIIAGQAKGRRLCSPGGRGGETIRPTADRAREALFNILGREGTMGCAVLDLFAGTGALGLEALSRGAESAVFVDYSPLALDLIRKNIHACGFSARAHVVRHDLLKGLFFWRRSLTEEGMGALPLGTCFDLVFLDPPYHLGLGGRLLTELQTSGLLRLGARVVFEDSSRETLPEAVGALCLRDRRRYGDTGFWLYETGVELRGT